MRLIKRMESEVQAKIAAIEDQAKKDAAEIEAAGAAVVAELEKSARLATEKRLTLEKAKRMAQVTLASKKEEAELKQGLVDAAFEAAQGKLDKLAGSSDYKDLLGRVCAEALADVSVPLKGSVREGDKGALEQAAKSAGVDVTVSEDLRGGGGGVVLKSDDGDVFIDNTLHTRLQRARTEGTLEAGKVLFGGADKAAPAPAKEEKAEAKAEEPAPAKDEAKADSEGEKAEASSEDAKEAAPKKKKTRRKKKKTAKKEEEE